MTKTKVAITVDDRERCAEVIETLSSMDDCRVRVERLAVGDFDIDGRILIERKTLPDLVASLKDGRLFQQALRLIEAQQWCALILEGTSRDIQGTGMTRQAIQGAMVTLALYLGIPILRAADPTETARLLLMTARQGHRYGHDGPARRGRLPRGKRRLQLHLLQGLPGIGPRRAARLLDHFGGIDRVIMADVAALGAVEGIGPSIAEALHWVVHEPTEEYAGDGYDALPPI